jgi:SAM-dependent methyltransferase
MYLKETFFRFEDDMTSPEQKTSIEYIDEGFVVCPKCEKEYPIIAGMPVLLEDTKGYTFDIDFFKPSSEHLSYSLEPTKKIGRLLQKYKVDTALDVACGLGAYTSYFACNTLVSFDISPYFIMKCIEKEGRDSGRHWFVADVMNIPFKNDSFDLIFASSILEHLEPHEVKLAIGKFNSLLRNEGIIQIDVPNNSRTQDLLRKTMTHLGFYDDDEFVDHPELGHHSLFLRKDLEKLGFDVHGCIGWVTRQKLPLGVLWEFYDLIGWYLPSLAGTLIGLKGVTNREVPNDH